MTPRLASAALLPLADALALLLPGLTLAKPQRLGLGAAFGAIAAADVVASADLPTRSVAARDGWAVPFVGIAGASPHAPVLLADAPGWRDAGEALPDGTDTVLSPEAFEPGQGGPHVVADAPPGDGARPVGADLRVGAALVAVGERVTALHILALAAAGIGAIEARVPQIKLVVTGRGREDALTPALTALAAASGCCVAEVAAVPDRVEAIAAAIESGDGDAVLVIGGTGFGRTDHSAAALDRAGTVRAHGIALRPGETAAFGTARDRPVLLLPGRPDAALSVFLSLGRPMLRALTGERERARRPMPLLRKVSSAIGLSEVVFVREAPDGLDPLGGADLPLHRLLRADGAILIPPNREGYPDGALVDMMPL